MKATDLPKLTILMSTHCHSNDPNAHDKNINPEMLPNKNIFQVLLLNSSSLSSQSSKRF